MFKKKKDTSRYGKKTNQRPKKNNLRIQIIVILKMIKQFT